MMFNVEKIQVRGIDKLAFLGLLIINLSGAALLVTARQGPSMSEPIWLSQAGLGVSVPSGRGWRADGSWRSDGEAFVLNGSFSRHGGSTVILGFYCFPDSPYGTKAWLRHELGMFGGREVRSGTVSAAGLNVRWIHITNPRSDVHVYFGTTVLPGGQRLNIEIQQLSDNHRGQALFEALLQGIRLTK